MVVINRDLYYRLKLLAKQKGTTLNAMVEAKLLEVLGELENIKVYQKGKDLPIPGELEKRINEISDRLNIPKSAIIYSAVLMLYLEPNDTTKEVNKTAYIGLDHKHAVQLMALSSKLKKSPNEIIAWCLKNHDAFTEIRNRDYNEVHFTVYIPFNVYADIKRNGKTMSGIAKGCIEELAKKEL